MNKKTISYSFLSILTSGALIGLLTVDRAQAHPRNPGVAEHLGVCGSRVGDCTLTGFRQEFTAIARRLSSATTSAEETGVGDRLAARKPIINGAHFS